MNKISNEQLSALREKFLPGTRVELVRMNDPYAKLQKGTKGTVLLVDDIGTIHVKWDCASCLGVVFGEDCCKPVCSTEVGISFGNQRQKGAGNENI